MPQCLPWDAGSRAGRDAPHVGLAPSCWPRSPQTPRSNVCLPLPDLRGCPRARRPGHVLPRHVLPVSAGQGRAPGGGQTPPPLLSQPTAPNGREIRQDAPPSSLRGLYAEPDGGSPGGFWRPDGLCPRPASSLGPRGHSQGAWIFISWRKGSPLGHQSFRPTGPRGRGSTRALKAPGTQEASARRRPWERSVPAPLRTSGGQRPLYS